MDSARISSAVDSAFEAFKGLSETATLEKETVSGFNFGTGEINSTSATATITVIRTSVVHDENGIIYKYVAKTVDFDSSVGYTTLVIGGVRYFINKAEVYEGVTELELRGEDV